ncbi:MAG: hypothetical protein NC340_10725, partial [Ruminococcus flavefaciens]|nr:hypothetical protein [Ruminococcus flavefaciens]
IIAGYIPYCDWTSIISGSNGDEISTAFKKHMDEIERTVFAVSENGMEFFECGSFSGVIEPDGGLTIYCYMTEDDIIAVSFKSSPELYEEIYSAMNSEITEMISEQNTMFYANGSGQKSKTISFEDFDTESICMLIDYNGWTWTAINGEYPEGEFFGIGSLIIQPDNSIYDCNTGMLYRAENQGSYGIYSAIENMITQDDAKYISYLIASSDNRFDTLSGDIYYSDTDLIDGEGVLFYDNENNNEYVFIAGDDSSNSIEFTMKNNLWESTHITDGWKQNYNGSGFMDSEFIEYGYIKDDFLLYLSNAMSVESDISPVVISRYDYFWNVSVEYDTEDETVSVQANLDSFGNVIYMSVLKHTSDSITEQTLFMLGDGDGNGITYDTPELAEQYGF